MLKVNPSLAAYYPSQLLPCNTFSWRFVPTTSCREQLNNDSFIHSSLLLSPTLKECPPRGDTLLRWGYSIITVMGKHETPFLWDKKNLESNRNSNICLKKIEFDRWYRPSQLIFGKKFTTVFPFSLPFFCRLTDAINEGNIRKPRIWQFNGMTEVRT